MRLGTILFVAAAMAAVGCNDRDEPDGGMDMPDAQMMGGENTAALCSDGMDNDDNGFADCNDRGCCSVVTCDPSTTCGRLPDGGGDCTPTGAEDSEAACTDGVDNDCNGFFDCRDFACSAFCGAENSNTTCNDGLDNDTDGFTDCDDRDCEERVVCAGEATNANCSDGMDNDEDGMTDCMDEDCQQEAIVVCDGTTPTGVSEDMWAAMIMTRCTNGTDDDGDARFDCGEFSCLWNYPACEAPAPERFNAACADGIDNDMDGLTDCEETACQQEGIVVCDGASPADPLPGAAEYESLSNAECSNGMNEDAALEDGGTFVDCMDFSCSQNPDVTVCPGENSNELCMDGMDNDDNGFTDCMDFGCSQNPAVTICPTERSYEACSDGIDNDMNGFVDCDDFSCAPMMGTRSPACF
ncbi:MAG: hypothetical protein RLO52_43055 [Sandaracinaceae bacterium]